MDHHLLCECVWLLSVCAVSADVFTSVNTGRGTSEGHSGTCNGTSVVGVLLVIKIIDRVVVDAAHAHGTVVVLRLT